MYYWILSVYELCQIFHYNVDIYLYIYGVQFCTNMSKNENDDRSVNHFSWSAVLKSSHVCRHDKWLTSWQQYKTMTSIPLWSCIFYTLLNCGPSMMSQGKTLTFWWVLLLAFFLESPLKSYKDSFAATSWTVHSICAFFSNVL